MVIVIAFRILHILFLFDLSYTFQNIKPDIHTKMHRLRLNHIQTYMQQFTYLRYTHLNRFVSQAHTLCTLYGIYLPQFPILRLFTDRFACLKPQMILPFSHHTAILVHPHPYPIQITIIIITKQPHDGGKK